MIELPPIVISRPKTAIDKKHFELKQFGKWDEALEDILSCPISPNLESRNVHWGLNATMVADQVCPFNTSMKTSKRETLETAQMRAKDQEMRTQEHRVRHMITSPLTPRKKNTMPSHTSLQSQGRPRRQNRDKHKLEKIIKARNMNPNQFDDDILPPRRTNTQKIARGYSIPIPIRMKNAAGGTHYFS